jgi:glycosyltransferase involved in cell wall biosynthesis
MKIVFCIDTIDYIGGMERVTVAKANAFSLIEGNYVTIVVGFKRRVNDSIDLSSNVKLVDLGIPYYNDYEFSGIKALLYHYQLRKQHRQKLQLVLNQMSPDVVISVGSSERFFLPYLKISSNPVFIREMHMTKFYNLQVAKTRRGRLLAWISYFIDYNFKIKKYDCISVLTQSEYMDNWKGNPKVVVIPNPLIIHEEPKVSFLKEKIVMSAGRLAESKNFSSLISAWKYVNETNPDWKLHIYGDGPCRSKLQNKIEKEGLTDCVVLCGFASDINNRYHNSSIFVLTSTSEAFSLVIIEAMAHGLPIVSYDCPYGPKDIIDQEKEGFVVPLNNEKCLSEKINLLIRDEEKRREMGANALKKSKMYSMDFIIDRWMSLFPKLLIDKRG